MSMLIRRLGSLLCFFACVGAAASTVVYKSVDGSGAVTFSDTPPAEGISVETLSIVVPVSNAADSLQQLEAMRQTKDRMASDRQEREAQRELGRLRAEAAASSNAQRIQAVTEQVRYKYIYLPPPIAPPWRPGYNGPPQRPGFHKHPSREGIIPGPNSQLMRPILSRPRN
jgi:hypothetical protein